MKLQLKKEILKKRSKLPADEAAKKSRRIKKKLLALPIFKKAKSILFYVSFKNEVDTYEMIKSAFGKKDVIVPITNKKNNSLIISKLKCLDDLCCGCFGIPEPRKSKIKRFNKKNLDLVIVPGVVFDRGCNRIGFGHGYYDKFLRGLSTKTKTIGLAYDFQIVDKLKAEKHDIPVDIIITEKMTIKRI